MWPQQQLLAQTGGNTNAVKEDLSHQDRHRCLCPQHKQTQQIDFASFGTDFPAHCTINFKLLWKKSKGCFDCISGLGSFSDCFSYLLSNFFLHFHWWAQLCNLFDTFAGISSVFPEHVILGVRSSNDRRPVIGPTWKSQLGRRYQCGCG